MLRVCRQERNVATAIGGDEPDAFAHETDALDLASDDHQRDPEVFFLEAWGTKAKQTTHF